MLPVALWAICVYLAHCSAQWVGRYRDVVTEGGVVRGSAAEDGDYIAFLGVPYAAPPLGENRFKAPSPPLPWDGIFLANRTVMCPQRGQGDEDCLVANIFTPTRINHPLPVLVYIHGGSFIVGSGATSGVEPLIKENIIVVTINYRLGALGFLCLGIEEAPGNAGLKDQVAALKWVNYNIANFGGDPNQVTIYGMSAGGASVEFQVLAQKAKGLFQRVIVESGCATSVWTTDPNPVATAMTMAELLDYSRETENLYDLVDFYQQTPADRLSEMNYEFYRNFIDGTFGFVACVERELPGSDAFITQSPYSILTKEDYHKVPMMILFTPLEGLFLRSGEYYELNYRDRMEADFIDFVPADLIFDTPEIKNEIASTIKHFYFGNVTVSDNNVTNYLNFFGDYLIMHGILNSVEIHSKRNPVHLLEFAYSGSLGGSDEFYSDIHVAGHGDIVKHVILIRPVQNERDQLTVDRMAQLIANYVKFGNPTPTRTHLLPVRWPTVQPSYVRYLHLNQEFQVREDPYQDRKEFWDQLYSKYRRNISPVEPGILNH